MKMGIKGEREEKGRRWEGEKRREESENEIEEYSQFTLISIVMSMNNDCTSAGS